MEEERRAVLLPVSLVNRIEEKIRHSPYPSIESYVEEVLSEVLKAEEVEIHRLDQGKREETRERLRRLGYLE